MIIGFGDILSVHQNYWLISEVDNIGRVTGRKRQTKEKEARTTTSRTRTQKADSLQTSARNKTKARSNSIEKRYETMKGLYV